MVTSLHDVSDVEVIGHYRLRLTFSDGLVGEVDLSYLSAWDGVFTPLRDPAFFAQVRVDAEIGTITWPNGADLAPEVLYERAAGTPLRQPRQNAAGLAALVRRTLRPHRRRDRRAALEHYAAAAADWDFEWWQRAAEDPSRRRG